MKKREGFTLISVMIAVVMLSVGIMALAKTQFLVVQQTRIDAQREQSLQLASMYIEILRTRDPWTITSEGPNVIDETGAIVAGGKFTRTLTASDEGPQLLRITLTVTPNTGRVADRRTVTLHTFIFKVLT